MLLMVMYTSHYILVVLRSFVKAFNSAIKCECYNVFLAIS